MAVETTEGASALVLGLSPTALLVMRSLGRRGVQVFAADEDARGLARYSRFGTHVPALSTACGADDEALIAAIESFAVSQPTPPVLFVTSDAFMERLVPHYERLSRCIRFSTHLDEVAGDYLDKRRFYELCVAHDVRVPKTAFQQDVDDVAAMAAEFRYPAIIKPAFSHHLVQTMGGAKVLKADDPAALEDGYRRLAEVDDGLVVQEVIPGEDDSIWVAACYVSDTSEAVFVGRKIRQYQPRFGSASLAESAWDAEVAAESLRILRASGFRGLCGTEFKRDPRDGSLVMIEINARPTLWMGLTAASGMDLPWIAYRDAIGAPVQVPTQRDGVRWTYLPRDIQTAVYYLREGTLDLPGWVRSLKGWRSDAVLARDDIGPGLMMPVAIAKRLLRDV